MPITVVYAEGQLPDDALEREVFANGVEIVRRSVGSLAELAVPIAPDR